MNSIFDLAGGRKMVLSLLSLGALTLLAYTKPQAITTEFVTALIGLVTAFSASNVINTMKSAGNLSNLEPSIEPDGSLAEEVKVSTLNLQTQIDDCNTRMERLADVIQKSLLTKPQVPVNIYTQQEERQVQNEPKYTPTQADLNRQAINQYLTGSQPTR